MLVSDPQGKLVLVPGCSPRIVPGRCCVPVPARRGVVVPARGRAMMQARKRVMVPASRGVMVPARRGVMVPARSCVMVPAHGSLVEQGALMTFIGEPPRRASRGDSRRHNEHQREEKQTARKPPSTGPAA